MPAHNWKKSIIQKEHDRCKKYFIFPIEMTKFVRPIEEKCLRLQYIIYHLLIAGQQMVASTTQIQQNICSVPKVKYLLRIATGV